MLTDSIQYLPKNDDDDDDDDDDDNNNNNNNNNNNSLPYLQCQQQEMFSSSLNLESKRVHLAKP